MKKRVIAILGIFSPLLFLAICMAGIVLIGAAGWWLFDQEENSRLIRIMSLAPLKTPQAIKAQVEAQDDESSPSPELAESASPFESDPELQEPLATTEIVEPEVDIPLTSEEIEETLGFSLPDGSVNSITQAGLANRLVVPGLNLDAPIILSPIENQTWKVDHLGQSIGHLEGTAPPGSKSNLVLAGHVTLSAGVNGPFSELDQLAPGDVLYVYDEGQEFQYVIDGMQIVDRTSIEVTFPSETGQITLITCSNWDHNEQRYIDRVVVTGHLAEG